MSNTVIELNNISKLYRLGEVGTGTLSHDLNRWWHRLRGKEDPYAKVGEENNRESKGGEYVWAIQDINFKVNQGDVLGVIGKNGAGKSTLLKILSRVTAPTKGTIKAKGRIASLLEVGTGFHPELTGRENIFLNGAILGMTKTEIRRKFDEIVSFSGVERYIDTPVKRYSSGMYVRLAFAVAAHLESEILIVDEVLAVGDVDFQKKCLGKMEEVSNRHGKTVLFVSHNMGAVKNLCKHTVFMERGRVKSIDDTAIAIEKYLSSDSDVDRFVEWRGDLRPGDNSVKLNHIKILNERGSFDASLTSDNDVIVEIEYQILNEIKDLRIVANLLSYDGTEVFSTSDFNYQPANRVREQGIYKSNLHIPRKLLNISRYYVSVDFDIPTVRAIITGQTVSFSIDELIYNEMGITISNRPPGVVHPVCKWDVKKTR